MHTHQNPKECFNCKSKDFDRGHISYESNGGAYIQEHKKKAKFLVTLSFPTNLKIHAFACKACGFLMSFINPSELIGPQEG